MSYAIIHEKLCDHYVKCPAMLHCAKEHAAICLIGIDGTSNRKIAVKRDRCAGETCGACINHCGLFRIADSREAEDILRAEFDEDPRNNESLQEVERFGCDVFDVERYRLNTIDSINAYIADSSSDRYDLLEFVDENHVLCAFQGISIRRIFNIFPNQLNNYRKFIAKQDLADDVYKTYDIKDLPAILLLQDSHIIGVIYGRFCVNLHTQDKEIFQALREKFLTFLNPED